MIIDQATLIEILDRRFRSLEERSGQDYLLHFISFTEFLWSDPQLAPFAQQALHDLNDAFRRFEFEMEGELDPLQRLRDKLVKVAPRTDDSTAQPPKDILDRNQYKSTLAFADDLLKGVHRLTGESFSMSPGIYDDATRPGQILSILRSKISSLLDEDDQKEKARVSAGKSPRKVAPRLDKLWAECKTLEELHRFRFRRWVNYRRTSGGQSLVNMKDIASRLNRDPIEYTSIHEIHKVRPFSDVMGFGYMDDLLYGTNPDQRYIGHLEGSLRGYVRIAYDWLRESIGRLGARMLVANQFATRCSWYEAPRVRQLGEEGNELELTRYMALYLFDQGLPVVTRMRLGVHELDIADPTHGRILIEAKVTRAKDQPSKVRETIIQGVSQVHSYLNGVAAAWGVREAYLAVFRLGGHLVDMPEVVPTPRFSIYPVLIDVGDSADSGHKQPKPVIITEADVFAAIED